MKNKKYLKNHPLVTMKLTSNGYMATVKDLEHVVYYHTGQDWSTKEHLYINKGLKIYEVLSERINPDDFLLLKVFYNQVIRVFDPDGGKYVLVGYPQHNEIQEQIEALTDSVPIDGEGFLIVFKDGGVKAICHLWNLYNEIKYQTEISI